MKKLMILTAALATGIMAYGAGELSNTFVASQATADNWTTGWVVPEGEGKATLDTENKVLKIATGSAALSRYVKNADSPFTIAETGNLYFDVSLDVLGQALDEIPTLPDTAQLALFLLDTTEIEGAPAGTNFCAIAQNPAGGKMLAFLSADVNALLSDSSRLTVKAYGNVKKSGKNGGFMVIQNGGRDSAAQYTEFLNVKNAFAFDSDGNVNWSKSIFDNTYLNGMLISSLSEKSKSVLLNLQAESNGRVFTALDFVGNASISEVTMTDDADAFAFIKPDEIATMLALDGVTVTAEPAESYDPATGKLLDSCRLTVTLTDPNRPILKVSNNLKLVDGTDNVFDYAYTEGDDASIWTLAVAAYFNGTAYESLAAAVLALNASSTGGELKLNQDITTTDLDNGCLTLTGTITLDLAGQNIVATGDASDENHGVVYLSEGSLTIINSDADNVGRVESTVSGRPAVCCEAEDAKIRIEGGIFKGLIRDIVLESSDDEIVVTPNITIVGGKFTDDPEKFIDKTAYHVTLEDGYYVVIAGATPSVEPATPGEEKEYASEEAAQEAADAINADKENTIKVPEALAESDKTAYVNLFEATVNGTKVTLALTAVATEDLQAQVDAEVKKVDVAAIAAATETSSQTLTTTPGIFYSVVAGDTLTGMKVKSCTMATSNETEITLPKFEGSGFYKIQATITKQTVE